MNENFSCSKYNRLSSFLESYYCEDNYKKINEFKNLSTNEVNSKGLGLVKFITGKVNKKLSSISDSKMLNDTKGDFSKFRGFDTVSECIYNLKKSNNLDDNDKTIIKAYENVLEYNNDFKKAYSSNNAILKNLYISVGYGIVSGISFTIANKVTNSNNFGMRNGISNNLIMKNLDDFNIMVAKGQLDSIIKNMKDTKTVTEDVNIVGNLSLSEDLIGVIGITAFVIMACIAAVYIARGIVYNWFATRIAISNYLKMLANYLNLNTTDLDNNRQDYKDVKGKQEETSKKLVELSNKVIADIKVSDNEAEEEIEKDTNESKQDTSGNNDGSYDGDFF